MDELIANAHEDFIYQQDGAPPHWSLIVWAYLNDSPPGRWIGRAGGRDNVMLKWLSLSPDLNPGDFFLWGCVKSLVYIPLLLANVKELKQKITTALGTVTQDMLQSVLEEIYRLDVCRVTRGARIEHL